MRRLFLLVSAVVLVDTMFFAAVAPLLPHYSDELDLSKTAAGVLTAAYPAGTFAGALPAGWLAARWGVKPTLLLGLALLGDHQPRVRVRQHHRAARRRALRPGHRRRVHVGGGHGLARLRGAAGAARRADRLRARRRDRRASCSAPCWAGGHRRRPRAGVQRRWPWSPRASPPGRGRRPACRPEPSPGLPALARALTAPRRAGRLLAVHRSRPCSPARSRCWSPLRLDELGASGAAIGAVFLVAAAVEARDQPDRRPPVRPPRPAGADPRGAGRRGGDGGSAAAAGHGRCCSAVALVLP